ncbi:MAG TPA: tRNA (adenosine(37)-N6)-threonylcarbamoyltransferase complex dimerization subunit type 1 TsaB [Treponemataceae bacterium]|nr:tRNA (adenosine(37)-N6)-threonylcarbamoyltransferase complex dimerization subunit type 1 TsaB [Treponemataceae bacterium]
MKALAIDSAASCISFAAVNEKKSVVLSLDIGMHQSENLVPGIQKVMQKVALSPKDLDFICLDLGPGSFTGLRLAFSALKAFQVSFNIPLYAIPTLEAYAYPWSFFQGAVLSVLDAKKQRFYAQVFRNGQSCTDMYDADAETIVTLLDTEENVLICGPDAQMFEEQAKSIRPTQNFTRIKGISTSPIYTLLDIARQKFNNKESGLLEYEGPLYIRKSDAELSLKK